MALVPAKCTSCGGTLEVDATQKAAICPFCGSAYVVQDAIEQYNITNVYKIDNANLKFDHKQLFSDRIEAAEKQLRVLKDYTKALNSFAALENDVPEDYRIWSGKLEAQTRGYNADFSSNIYLNNKDFFPHMLKNYEHAYKTGDNAQRMEINSKFLDLLRQCCENIQSAETVLEDNSKKRSKYRNKGYVFLAIGILFIVLTAFLTFPGLSLTFPGLIVIIQSVSDGTLGSETTMVALALIAIGLVPPVLTLFLSILCFSIRKKFIKKDKEISVQTAHIIKDELHLNLPGFTPEAEYNNMIHLCKQKISLLQNAIERCTISK